MEINDFITSLQSYFERVKRISCYALATKGNNVSAQELKFESGELEKILNNKLSALYNVCKERQLKEYPYGDCKDTIEYRSCNHESLEARVKEIKRKLDEPDIAYDSKKRPNFNSYVLKIDDGSNIVYLFTKNNPVVNLQKGKRILYMLSVGDKLKVVDTKLYHFPNTTDVIIFEDNVYFVSLRMESSFGLEAYSHKQKEKFINLLKEVLNKAEFEELQLILKPKNARSFKVINEEKLKKLQKREEKKKIAHELSIPLTLTGDFDFTGPGCKEKFIDYLQNKLAKDVDEPDQCVGGAGPLKRYS